MDTLTHPFDMEMDPTDSLDLFVEELPDQNQMATACMATGAPCFSCIVGPCLATLMCK